MRRAIKINGTDLILELSRAVGIKTEKNMIHFDQLPDGTWRLIYNENLITNFSKIENFEIIRED